MTTTTTQLTSTFIEKTKKQKQKPRQEHIIKWKEGSDKNNYEAADKNAKESKSISKNELKTPPTIPNV